MFCWWWWWGLGCCCCKWWWWWCFWDWWWSWFGGGVDGGDIFVVNGGGGYGVAIGGGYIFVLLCVWSFLSKKKYNHLFFLFCYELITALSSSQARDIKLSILNLNGRYPHYLFITKPSWKHPFHKISLKKSESLIRKVIREILANSKQKRRIQFHRKLN